MRRAMLHLKRCDPVLAAIIDRVGPFALTYREPTFEAMVRAIAFQQLNGKAAATIFNRLVEAAGGITPEKILALTEVQMRAVGLSKQKLTYIRDLAAKTQSGELDFALLPALPDADVIEHLTRIKGIGVWSAQMFLIFALRRPDVMPTADYGIRVAIQKAYLTPARAKSARAGGPDHKRKLPDPKTILKISAPWQPWRSVACWYLWRSLDSVIPE